MPTDKPDTAPRTYTIRGLRSTIRDIIGTLDDANNSLDTVTDWEAFERQMRSVASQAEDAIRYAHKAREEDPGDGQPLAPNRLTLPPKSRPCRRRQIALRSDVLLCPVCGHLRSKHRAP